MSGGRARLAPKPTRCEQCRKPLPEQLGAGRPRRKCLECAPPAKGTRGSRARRSRPVLVESPPGAEDSAHVDVPSFGVRGQAMWDEWASQMPSPGSTALLREASRLADRAERMNQLINGYADAFATLKIDDMLEEVFSMAADSGVAEVHINLNVSSVAIEARNTATALRSIVAELRTAVKQAAGADQEGADDPIAAIAASMAGRAPSGGNVVQMRKR